MIYNIYILDADGIPLVSRIYGKIEVDPTLISGYISAQSSFFKEVTGQDVEMISTKDYNFWLKRLGRFLLAIVASKDSEPKAMKWKLSQIQLAFIMNLEKESLCSIIDSVALSSLLFILEKTKASDLVKIIKYLILDNTIIISGRDESDVTKYIYSLLALSPNFRDTYIYDDKGVFVKNAIIGSTSIDLKNKVKDNKFLCYDLDSKQLAMNNLEGYFETNALDAFVENLIFKSKSMSETSGIDYIKNSLRRILKVVELLKELLRKKKKILITEAMSSLDISAEDLPIAIEVFENKVASLKKVDNVICYEVK